MEQVGYATTIHAINSMILKASKLTAVARVYRGVSGGVLPETFRTPNEQGVCGGVERAFVSTSRNRAEAVRYATATGQAAMLFEIQMGMVDRGCDVACISQYPREEECLFAPLTAFELLHTRVDGPVLIAEVRLSVNLKALTLEQVVNKLKRSQLDLIKVIRADLVLKGDEKLAAVRQLDALRRRLQARDGGWFADPKHYQESVKQVFHARDVVSADPPRMAHSLNEPSHVARPKTKAPEGVPPRLGPGSAPAVKWTAEAWLESSRCGADVALALHAARSSACSDELDATRSLAQLDEHQLAERLRANGLVARVAATLHAELCSLKESATPEELRSEHGKFVEDEQAFELNYTGLGAFHGGLEAHIGAPDEKVLQAMEREHTAAADSRGNFTTPNYGITTTPETEWRFVAKPDEQRAWPVETEGVADSPDKRRRPMTKRELSAARNIQNEALEALGEPMLIAEECYGARLYTGPM